MAVLVGEARSLRCGVYPHLTLSLVRERASEKPSARSLSTEADEKLFSL
jgi:hypothetical protein